MTTEYACGNREQFPTAEPCPYDGEDSTGGNAYVVDARGDMVSRNWEPSDGPHLTQYDWNEDNRLIFVTTWCEDGMIEVGMTTQFHYDHEGRRLLMRGEHEVPTIDEQLGTRCFFHGLTEDIKKVSDPGAHGDGAFEFAEKEDGDSAPEWYVNISGSGISVSSVPDSPRRSNVIKCQNDSEAKPVFRIGEKDGTSENPNDSAWNSTKRVVSFWMKGGASAMNVQVSASTGAKYVQYVFGMGTNGSFTGGNAKVYLGYAASSEWQRFERNVEADFEAYAGGGATWTDTDGLYITWPQATPLSYAFYIDDIRLSDSLTVEHNTLGPGVVGHILRHTTWDATTLARTGRWFHCDQVGSVMDETNAAGALATTHHMDAFGNVQASWDVGFSDAPVRRWRFETRG